MKYKRINIVETVSENFSHKLWSVSYLSFSLSSSSSSNKVSSSVDSYARTKYLLIAVGAMERPMPFKGWTLPGVMACTAVDALFKS